MSYPESKIQVKQSLNYFKYHGLARGYLLDHFTTLPDSSKEVSKLGEYIVEHLTKKALFKRVVPSSIEPDASTDLRINTKILWLKKGGFVSAMFVGGGAGVRVELSLVDLKTGAPIGAFESSRVSSSSTTSDVIFDVAKRIAKFIEENI